MTEEGAGRTVTEGGLGRRAAGLLLAALSLLFTVLAMHQAWNDSITVDEAIYHATGLAVLHEREAVMNYEAPVVPKALHALPMLLGGVDVPLEGVWREAADGAGPPLAFGVFAREFVEAQERGGDLQRAVFLGRLVPILESIATAIALHVLGTRLAGRAVGVAAAGLWLTTPLVVGLGHLNALDVTFTAVFAWTAVALERYLRSPSMVSAVILGAALGGALLVRHTGALLLVAILVAIAVGARHLGRAAIGHAGAVVLVAWALIWVGMAVVTPADLSGVDVDVPGDRSAVAEITSRVVQAVPLPATYQAGFEVQATVGDEPSPGYLLGSTWDGSRWWYWPGSMLVKLPISFLVVVILAPWAWRRAEAGRRRRAALVLGVPVALLVLFLLPFPKPVGIRYLLPALALMTVAGAAAVIELARRRAGRLAFVVLALVQVGSLVESLPHSLAWTAPPFRPGWAVVSESNLDWGQDVGRLAQWMGDRHVYAAPFGGAAVEVETMPGYESLLTTPVERVRGWVAVNATVLTTYERRSLSWLRAYCHVDDIGGTILLYRFEQPPDDEPGPTVPVGRCKGQWSERAAGS